MIVWRGWGILVLLLTALCVALGHWIAQALSLSEGSVGSASIQFIFLIIASAACYFIGRKLNDKQTSAHHSLFFIRMEYWAIIILIAAVVQLVISLIS